jgi:hypothetical protein
VALPEGWQEAVADLVEKGVLASIVLAPLGRPAPDLLRQTGIEGLRGGAGGLLRPWRAYDARLAYLRHCIRSQAPLYEPLVQALGADRPDFVLVDRYAYAGLDACQKLGLPYAVSNPTLLLDMDGPPAYVPPPFCGLAEATGGMWPRLWHLIYRAVGRGRTLQALQELNAARRERGLW